jgi:hypothetical protein
MRRPLTALALPAVLLLGGAGVWLRLGNDAAAMVGAAQRFLAALDEGQRQKAALAFDDGERLRWRFVPGQYPGVQLGELSPAQKELAHGLLRCSLSSAGYLKTTSIVRLEQVLKDLAQQKGQPAEHRDPERYSIAVFGTPSAAEPWGWRFQGHHVSLNFSGSKGDLVATTPAFLGANPHVVRQGPLAGLRVLGAEEDLARALLGQLDDDQRKRALLDVKAPADVILGPDRAATFLGEPKGLPAAAMNDGQKELLMQIVREYAENLRPEFAQKQLERIRAAGLEKIAFAWAGSLEPGKPHYYRVHGPTFVVEYDNTQDDANHVHTVFRDLERDFGGDLLREHVEHGHHKEPEEAPPAASPAFTPTTAYGVRGMRGFRVLVSPELSAAGELCARVLDLLDNHLTRLVTAVPEPALAALREVPIWVERISPKVACMCYHVSGGWLVQNGYNPDKAQAVEVGNADTFLSWTQDQPWMVLHELAHAFHHRVLGSSNEEIRAGFARARTSGRYDSVLHVSGRRQRHYALTDDQEFFAELSESWFGTNDFYPFVRAELRESDPESCALIERLWRTGRTR